MAHRIEKLDRAGFALTPAWHGLGKVFDRPMTTEEVLGMTSVGDYEVLQTRGFIAYFPETGKPWIPTDRDEMPPAGVSWMPTDAYFNLRDDVEAPNSDCLLSPTGVGEGYNVVQNRELCEVADTVLGETGAVYESAGTLQNGKMVWLLARMPEETEAGGQRLRKYILIYSSHDGSKSIVIAATMIRVVCWNTLSAALSAEADNKVTLRHTSGVRDRIAEAIEAVQMTKATFERERQTFAEMSQTSIDRRFLDAYLSALYPNPEGKDGKARTGQAEKKRNRIIELIDQQPEAHGDGMRVGDNPSAFSVYNAVTHYWQHEGRVTVRGVGEDTPQADIDRQRSENRMRQNLLGGTQETERTRALDLLLRGDELVAEAVASN